MIRPKKYQEKQ